MKCHLNYPECIKLDNIRIKEVTFMRDPDGLHSFYEYADEVPDVIKIKDLPPCTIPDYDLNDEKSFTKYLQDIEKVVRTSFEYKQMINYLRNYCDMNKCSFYQSVSNADTPKIHIEIHHDPLSLYDIVVIVYNKRAAFHESLEVEHVAKEVMYLHYDMQVGLIPLSETVHELVHNQYLFVPSNKVYGKYKQFVMDYKPFIPLEQMNILDRIESLTSEFEGSEYNQILSKKFIYVDATGAYNLPRLEDVMASIKSHIRDIMDNPPRPIEIPKEEPNYWKPIIFEVDQSATSIT